MKRIVLLMVIGMLFGSQLLAQQSMSLRSLGIDPGRAVTDLVCPEGSVYSQTPNGVNGYSFVAGFYYSDNVLSSPGLVTSVTWWMMEARYEPTLSFDIFIHADAGGQPGTLIESFFDVTFEVINTGEVSYSYPVFQYSYTFPSPVNIPSGSWIGIRDLPDYEDYFHHHYWATGAGGDGIYWRSDGYIVQGADMAFCLGGGAPTPVSGWAIGIGLMLILAFSVYRIRKS